MKNRRISFYLFVTIYLVIGLMNLIYGADSNSRFFYFDNFLVRFIGVVFIISTIGLFLKKEIARKGIITALILSLIEIIIGVPENSSTTELVTGVASLLIIYLPGLLYFVFDESSLLERHQYGKVVKRYRMLAKLKRRKYLKENLLGLACIYEHDSGLAIEHFNNALSSAVGKNIYFIKGNLAIAYLQNRWYREALALLEELRTEGQLPIIPYTLALLINGQDGEAKKFYEDNELRDSEGNNTKKLLGFSPFKPETLESIRGSISEESLWLYKPLVKDLFEKWEIDLFYNSKNRYEILEKQAKNLVFEFEKQPELFNSASVRYMRSIISVILPRVNSYNECLKLWGLVDNYDQFTATVPIEEELKNECITFWRRVYRILFSTCTHESYNSDLENILIKEQIPPDGKNIIEGTSRCSLYVSESIGYTLRSMEINQHGFQYHYVDLVENSIVDEIITEIKPIMELMIEEPSTKEALEPLLLALVYNRESVTSSEIIDVFNKIPSSHHDKLENLYRRVVEKNNI